MLTFDGIRLSHVYKGHDIWISNCTIHSMYCLVAPSGRHRFEPPLDSADSAIKQCRSSLFSTTRAPQILVLYKVCLISRKIIPVHDLTVLPLLSPPLEEVQSAHLAILIYLISDTAIDGLPDTVHLFQWLVPIHYNSRAIKAHWSPLEWPYYPLRVVAKLLRRVDRGDSPEINITLECGPNQAQIFCSSRFRYVFLEDICTGIPSGNCPDCPCPECGWLERWWLDCFQQGIEHICSRSPAFSSTSRSPRCKSDR